MAAQRPLGVCVIGTGKMGGDHVRRIDQVVEGARVVAVVDVDEERAKDVAGRIEGCTAHREAAGAMAAEDVDAVLVASPGPAHEATLLEAFAAGLPVLCEKPLTPDAASALRVLEAEQRLGHRRVQVGFMRRHDSEYTHLKRLLDSGDLGRTLMLHHRHRNPAQPPWFTEQMLINDSVVHEMDVTRWLLGQEIAAVTVLKPAPTAYAPEGMSDPQFVLFETERGALVDVEIFGHCRFGYQVQAEAVCEKGTVRIGDRISPDYLDHFQEAYDIEVQAWVDATRRGEVSGPSVWDGYAAAAVCEAGVRAQGTGGRVAVELVERPALYA